MIKKLCLAVFIFRTGLKVKATGTALRGGNFGCMGSALYSSRGVQIWRELALNAVWNMDAADYESMRALMEGCRAERVRAFLRVKNSQAERVQAVPVNPQKQVGRK